MLNPFSLAFPTHWFSPSLHLPLAHVHTFSIPALPLILPPLFLPPTYTVMIRTFCFPPLICSLLRRQSPSPLCLPSLTQNVARKVSVNLDTPIKPLFLDLPGLASSHSSMDHVIRKLELPLTLSVYTCPLITTFSCFLPLSLLSHSVPSPSLLSHSVPSPPFSHLPILPSDTGIFSYTQSHSLPL